MKLSLVSQAADAFRNESYHLSLSLYRALGKKIGEKYVEGNVRISQGRLMANWPLYFSGMNYVELIEELGFGGVENIIYADIDLNTVDGSAIWLSSMTSILANSGKTILISKNKIKRNVIVHNILNKYNVLILTPENFDSEMESMDISYCVDIIRKLDDFFGNVKRIIVRGSAVAKKVVEDRRFYKRIYAYLTDFYLHKPDGSIELKDDIGYVDVLARQSKAFLVQTEEIEAVLRSAVSYPFKAFEIPPPVFQRVLKDSESGVKINDEIVVGYAGKIAPNWGVTQLIEWVGRLKDEGFKIKVVIIGDKISGAGNAEENRRYRSQMNTLLSEAGVERLGALSRIETIKRMSDVDFAWCWRPAEFEEHTLELSTKLVEGVSSGQACIAYPSRINVKSLGEDYPFFIRDFNDFKRLIQSKKNILAKKFVDKVYEKHSIENISKKFKEVFCDDSKILDKRKVCVATHDPKFIFPYFSYLKTNGVAATLDRWEWGGIIDENRSHRVANESDMVFCEWGLANAVWYSHNLPFGKKLIVRVHQQEIRKRAARFGREINKNRVDLFIFVSEKVRQEAIRLFGFDAEKTAIVPNFVLDEEYVLSDRAESEEIKLGMVGIIPQTKRFDLAVDLLRKLIGLGYKATLDIKGPRPEEMAWMRVGSRAKELEYYYDVYKVIESDEVLQKSIKFHGWGNDVAKFYECVDYILSPSDFESFHYALADGVLSGCCPIIWPWGESKDIYSPDWIVNDINSAVEKILEFKKKDYRSKATYLSGNRDLIIEKYGRNKIFNILDRSVF
nr:glycosyltransferase [Alcaligenes faecalis]